jgi:hypothetical protein
MKLQNQSNNATSNLVRAVAFANVVPVAAVLTAYIPWLLPIGFQAKLVLVAAGLIVALSNVYLVQRLAPLNQAWTRRQLICIGVIVVSAAYTLWASYLIYMIGMYL